MYHWYTKIRCVNTRKGELIYWKWIQDKGVNSLKRIQDKGVDSLKKNSGQRSWFTEKEFKKRELINWKLIQDKGVNSPKMNSTNTTNYRTVIVAASLVEAFSIVILNLVVLGLCYKIPLQMKSQLHIYYTFLGAADLLNGFGLFLLTSTFFTEFDIFHYYSVCSFVVWSFMILYYFLFLMHVYLSTNLWNFYTNKTVYSSTVYHLVKISKETPILYTYLVKGTCIFRAMEHGILELHRCIIWYAYA